MEELESLSEVIVKYSRRPMYILIAILLVSLTVITVLAVLYGISMNPHTKYLLIIDCGLSSCTFSLFEYTDWYGRSNAWVHQRSHYTISSGTSSFGDNPTADAEAILQETKAVITKGVPSNLQKDTRVFFGAAAGFRMLRKTNPQKAQRLMVAVKNALADLPPKGVVVSMTEDVRVVSGAEQGFYAWFAANYLMGNFGKEYSEFRYRPLLTLGALNLGDVSTQMTFVPLAEEALPKSRMKAMAFGYSYNLYSQSHLCYGVVTIRARYLAHLTQGSDLQKPVASPCHQSGLSMEVASDDIFQAPCITSTEEDIMGPSIPKPSGAPAKIAFRGDYNAARCGQAIESIFADGSFANVYRPRLRGDFAAIDKLREIVTSFKKTNHSAKVTRTEFVTAIDNFCLPPEEQATSEEKCLQGWIVKGLLEAYGFKNDSDWSTIIFLGNQFGQATWFLRRCSTST
ncbi:Ectonucleoside triphosphate diphosphohydrolase 1 [Taenia solium]